MAPPAKANGNANGEATINTTRTSSSLNTDDQHPQQQPQQQQPQQQRNQHEHEHEQHTNQRVKSGSSEPKVRHGFHELSEEWLSQLAEGYYTYFADKRHETQGIPHTGDSEDGGDWRVTDRQRTVSAALVLCLNLGVDPPDIVKTQPAARLEAWVDPQQYVDSKKALEQIGKNLQAQYESLSARTKYKQSLDPTIDDIKRFCVSMRRMARDDRILFHYNGHGVPRPTPSGEVWVFNRGYTQYIPLSIYELQTWLGAPVIYCYDCSGAGNILRSFNEFVQKRKQLQAEDAAKTNGGGAGGAGNDATSSYSGAGAGGTVTNASAYDTCIQLGACEADEILPMSPDLPADLFTCCISTPIETAVKWFLIQNSRGFVSSGLDPATIQIPGKVTDRRTPLGELNWIFTAITDTIAWSMLDPALFKRLFRQDLIVAAMFRNFLLAKRIMRAHNCHPVSSPEIPDTCDHPLWDSWDAAVNHCLLQISSPPSPTNDGGLFSDFFEQQLTAFEMWLDYQSGDVTKPPEQLPIVLQVLLSQIHRLRALYLLCRYLDLGPGAVRISLSIGFFIYVLKLLQSPAPELRPVLVFIWARIMAVHRPVQTDLVKDQGYMYFVNILIEQPSAEDSNSSQNSQPPIDRPKPADPAMCCFILAQFAHDYPSAQQILSGVDALVPVLEQNLDAESPLLREWSILLLAELVPVRSLSSILWRLKDPIPEVRAAAIYTLTAYLANARLSESDADMVGKAIVSVALDGSPLVRYELITFMSQFIALNESKFIVCAFTTLEEEFAASRYGGDMRSRSPAHGTVSLALWRCLLVLTDDAMPRVKYAAETVVDNVQRKLMRTPLATDVSQMAVVLLEPSELKKSGAASAIHDIWSSKSSYPSATAATVATAANAVAAGLSTSPRNNSQTQAAQFGNNNNTNNISNIISNSNINNNNNNNYNNYNGKRTLRPPQLENADRISPVDAQQLLLLHKQHPSQTPLKSYIRSAIQWIVGTDGILEEDGQPSQVQQLRPRASLASLVNQPKGRTYSQGSTALATGSHSPASSSSSSHIPELDGLHVPSSLTENGTDQVPEMAQIVKHTIHTKAPQNGHGLVLASDFREFCVEYFREPQLKPSESDEAGSKKYFEKIWRKSRNEKIMSETQVQKNLAMTGSWGNQTTSVEGVGEPPKKIVFAQFEPHLVVSDSTNVSVFDWQRGGKLLNRFHGGKALSDIHFINEDDVPLVLTASRDGMARVFKNYEDPAACQIVTSWWLFADLVHHQPKNPFVLVDWQQSRGHLLVGGDTRTIRVWDAAREQAITDIPVRTSAQLTALTSDKVAGNFVLGGFSDGAIHVYDRRLDKQNALVRRWKPSSVYHGLHKSNTTGHSSKVLNLRMQRGGTREVASGSVDGRVCLWDIRNSGPTSSFMAHTKEMRCMDIHEHAPVIATASRIAGVWTTSGRRVSTLKGPSPSLLSSKVSPVGSLAFHPHQMVLAMGNAEEPAISVFRCT